MTQGEADLRVEACGWLMAGGLTRDVAVEHTRAYRAPMFAARRQRGARGWALMAGATVAAVLPEVRDDGT